MQCVRPRHESERWWKRSNTSHLASCGCIFRRARSRPGRWFARATGRTRVRGRPISGSDGSARSAPHASNRRSDRTRRLRI